MTYTASFHNNGSAPNYKHNRRDENYIAGEHNSSVDLQREHITILDRDPVEVYKQYFSKSLDDWNQKNIKNRHNEKCMTMEQYIEKIQLEERQYHNELKRKRKKKEKTKLYARPRFVYEAIVQIGNIESVPQPRTQARKDFDEKIKAVYEKFIADWEKNNPNLVLTGVYLHFDEAGASHMHIDYVPVASGLKRGMETAPRLTEAFLQMGYESGSRTYTPQMQWQDKMRDVLVEIAKSFGIEASFEDRRRTGNKIIKEHHLDPYDYKLKQISNIKADRMKEELSVFALLKEKKKTVNDIATNRAKLADQNKEINRKRQIIGKQQQDNRHLNQAKTELNKDIKNLQDEADKLQNNVDDLTNEYDIIRQQIKDISLKRANLSAELDKYYLETKAEAFNKAKEAYNNTVEKYERQYKKRTDALEKREKDLYDNIKTQIIDKFDDMCKWIDAADAYLDKYNLRNIIENVRAREDVNEIIETGHNIIQQYEDEFER